MVKTYLAVAAAGMLISAGAIAQDATKTDTQAATARTGATVPEQLGDAFTTVPGSEKLSSSIVGLDVYNGKSEDVGTIKDIAYGTSGVRAYILGVGGLMGMGDHYVAVKPSAISLTWDNGSKKWHATLDATADQLKAAPAFTYPSNS